MCWLSSGNDVQVEPISERPLRSQTLGESAFKETSAAAVASCIFVGEINLVSVIAEGGGIQMGGNGTALII